MSGQSIDELISEWVAEANGKDVVLAVEAERFVETVDRQALSKWLRDHAAVFVADRMGQRLRSQRATAEKRRQSRAFASSPGSFSTETVFDKKYCVNGEDLWRRFGDMVAADCRYVARDRTKQGNALLFEAVFMEAVAAKVGRRKVEQVFTEEQIEAMETGLQERFSQRRAA